MDLDDRRLLAAMQDYVDCGRRLADAADVGDARTLIDLAEAKAIAGMRLRSRLREAGLVEAPTAPVSPAS